jgi:hypothetical protein
LIAAWVIAVFYNTITDAEEFVVTTEICVLQLVLLVGSLWAFRVAGYRTV